MRHRTKVSVVTIALLFLATVLSLSGRQVQAQSTPNLSVKGAIYGGTNIPNSTQGPAPVCYTSVGAACAGSLHMVVGATTAPVSGPCGANSTCDLNGSTSLYTPVVLTGAAIFSNAYFTCSATIFTLPPAAPTAYVGYCQPDTGGSMFIYMYNPGSAITGSPTVNITYTASGS
jgi:hypothetical protein